MNLIVWLPALFMLGATGAAGVVLTSRRLSRFSRVLPTPQHAGNSIATSAHVHPVLDRWLRGPPPVLRGLEDSRTTPRRRS
jgi:hypothetical protein